MGRAGRGSRSSGGSRSGGASGGSRSRGGSRPSYSSSSHSSSGGHKRGYTSIDFEDLPHSGKAIKAWTSIWIIIILFLFMAGAQDEGIIFIAVKLMIAGDILLYVGGYLIDKVKQNKNKEE